MVRLENICNTEKTLWFRWGSCLIEHGGRSTYDTHSPAVNTEYWLCCSHISGIQHHTDFAASWLSNDLDHLHSHRLRTDIYSLSVQAHQLLNLLLSVLRLLLMCVWLLVFNLYFMFHYFLCVCVWECVFHPYNETHPCVGCFSAKSRRDRGKNWRRKNME